MRKFSTNAVFLQIYNQIAPKSVKTARLLKLSSSEKQVNLPFFKQLSVLSHLAITCSKLTIKITELRQCRKGKEETMAVVETDFLRRHNDTFVKNESYSDRSKGSTKSNQSSWFHPSRHLRVQS